MYGKFYVVVIIIFNVLFVFICGLFWKKKDRYKKNKENKIYDTPKTIKIFSLMIYLLYLYLFFKSIFKRVINRYIIVILWAQ
jgi:hypothetical protein